MLTTTRTNSILDQHDPTVRIFHIYRLSLSGILLVSYLLLEQNFFFSVQAPLVFLITAVSWFAVATITSFSSYLSRHLDWLTCTSFVLDVLALSTLGWASNGLSGGMFFLLLPSAALAGLMLPTRLGLLVASVATLGTFAAQTALILDFKLAPTVYFPSGILGTLIFLTTVVFRLLAQRIARSRAEAQAHRQVAESLQYLNQEIIERMQTGVLVLDKDLRIQMANQAARQLLNAGLSHRPLNGAHLGDFPGLSGAYEAWHDNAERRLPPFTHSFSGVSIQPGFNSLQIGERQQTLCWLEDMREVRQRAQQFKFQSLSKLSSGLAHEVRNPLSAVQQANDLLLQSPALGESDHSLTEIIDRHCRRMNDIIDVVQQLSRRVEPHPEQIPLAGWVESMLCEFRESHHDIGIIETELPDDHEVSFDPRHLKQIFTNILENGIRHGSLDGNEPQQSIRSLQSENGRYVYIELRDNGPGIPREDQRKVFDPFFTTGSGGSGLGLYLARELCEANYASINYLYEGDSPASGFFRITCPVEPLRF